MNTEKITLSCDIDDWDNSEVGLVVKDYPDALPVANCYIIAPRDKVSLPVVTRINQFWAPSGSGGLNIQNKWINDEAWTAEIIWADIADGIDDKVILKPIGSGNSPLFVSVETGTSHGNIVIGVKKTGGTGDYLWSWHLWITDFDPDTVTATLPSGLVVMDRNLGAITSNTSLVGSYGLLYQWGRKDPFVGGG